MSPRAAITTIFALNGAVLGTWGARIPAIQDRLDVGPGALSLALAGLAAGALLAMPTAGRMVSRHGSAVVVRIAVAVLGVLLVLPAVLPSLALVVASTFVIGMANGSLDVSQNAQGVEVERAAGRTIFSSMHAAFSFGGLCGAGLGAASAALDLSAGASFAIAGAAAVVVGTWAGRGLIPDGPAPGTVAAEPGDAGARGADDAGARGAEDGLGAREAPDAGGSTAAVRSVWPLRVLAFASLFCEGAAMDWSAVHLRDIGAASAVAALAYGAFSIAMATGRLSGDRLVERLGPVTLARRGGAIAGGAMAISLIAGVPLVGLLAYVAIGAGLSVVIPLIFRAAAAGVDAGPALAGVTTTGYLGLLSGPPIIGVVASVTSVPGALVLVIVAAAGICVGAPALRTPSLVPA